MYKNGYNSIRCGSKPPEIWVFNTQNHIFHSNTVSWTYVLVCKWRGFSWSNSKSLNNAATSSNKQHEEMSCVWRLPVPVERLSMTLNSTCKSSHTHTHTQRYSIFHVLQGMDASGHKDWNINPSAMNKFPVTQTHNTTCRHTHFLHTCTIKKVDSSNSRTLCRTASYWLLSDGPSSRHCVWDFTTQAMT